ncbi:MAG: hypothetical protein M1815_005272 [Lichina confinis]|nr:MAG: hypothetical protein M1815_005272 [Lichina confinis]
MEGLLLVPPEKASIIGKSLWKTRFVSLGPAPPAAALSMRSNGPRSTSSSSSSRLNSSLKQLKLGSRNASQISVEQALPANDRWLCVYKRKGDHEPVSLYPVSSIVSCTVQDYIHRKTHSAQPTLIVTVQAGGPKKNRQARRLSQTGGLSTSHTTTILFRAVQSAPDSIRSWQEALQEILDAPPDQYRSDATLSYSSNRPSTSTARPTLPPSQESYMSASGSHPGSALSIRTSHTAVSSPISSSPQNAVHTFESSSSPRSDHFGSPSPYRTVSPPFPSPPAVVVRETILDRAFKMNCIPGAAPALEGEPAMNSIARFEALMQDVEARRAADARPAGPDGRAHDRDEKDIIPAAAQRALEYIASGQRTSCSTIDSIGGGGEGGGGGGGRSPGGTASPPTTSSVRPSRRPRPASLALPSSTSLRSPILDSHPTDRRRSSVSTTPSSLATSSMMNHPTTILTTNHQSIYNNNNNNHHQHHHHHHHPPHHRTMSTTNPSTTAAATTSTSSKRLSLADFTRRFSSSSSVIMARTTTTTSSRSSGISDVSFHCVGEDDSSWGDMLVMASGDGGGAPRRTTTSTSTPSTRGAGGAGTVGGSRIAGSVSNHHHHPHQHHHHHHRLSGSAIGV